MKKKIVVQGLIGLMGLIVAGGLSSCSVSADSPLKLLPFPNDGLGTITDLPLAGPVQTRYLKLSQGFARASANGEMVLNFVAKEGLDCSMNIPERPYMSALVPKAPGTYVYDLNNSSGDVQRPVNFIMNDVSNGSPMNVISDSSTLIVESITSKYVTGKLAAKSTLTGYTYDVSGSFQLLNCASDLNQALKVLQKDTVVFTPKYSEVVTYTTSGRATKSLRIMDKVPTAKCSSFQSWFQTEVPIKYLELPIANEVGAFKINFKEMTIGLEGAQSGIAYQVFEGTGEVIAKDRFNTTVAISAKDTLYNTSYQVVGRITANNCE